MGAVLLPEPSVVNDAIIDHGSVAAAARALGVNPRTLQERVQRGYLSGDSLSTEPSLSEIPVFIRDYTHLDHLYVYPLGDVHKGASMHDEARWLEWLDYLRGAENSTMLGTGDFLNAGIVGSKSDVYGETMTVGRAKREIRDELNGVPVDLLMPGNHEYRIWRATGDCPIRDIAEWHDIPYAQHAAMVVYRVGDVEYEIYLRHGTGNGQSLAQLGKSAMVAMADVYVTGHTHKQAATADEFFVREDAHMIRERRYYVSSGSFLAYEGYAAERGYTPTRIGAPRILLDGSRRDVHVSI